MDDPFPLVEVAAALLLDARGEKLLLDHNPNWGGFAPPMTKVGTLPGPTPKSAPGPESPLAAAVRAAAEVLGRPILPATLRPLPGDVPPFARSGRDGAWKRYRFHLFVRAVDFPPAPLPGHAAVWLTPAEVATHDPVTPTARHLLAAVPWDVIRAAAGV